MVSTFTRVVRHTWWGILLAACLPALLAGDGGPPGKPLERPNALDVAWTFRTDGRALDVSDTAAAMNDAMLAIPQGPTVSVADTRTGRLLSTVKTSAGRITPVGFSGGVMLAVEERDSGEKSLNGYDPATGGKLWRRTRSPGARPEEGDDWLRATPLLTGPGPVVETSGGRLVGLAPRTGAVRWSKRNPGLTRCEQPDPGDVGLPSPSDTVGATTRRIALLDRCSGPDAHLVLLDPRDGDTVRRVNLGPWRDSVGLSAAGDTVGVELDDELRVFTDSGRELLRRKAARKSEVRLAGADGGTVYLSESHFAVESDPGSLRLRTLRAVRVGSGRTVWKLPQEPMTFGNDLTAGVIVSDVETAGGYGGDVRWSVGDARLQGPGASSLTDLAGRRSARVPWPVAGTFVGVSGPVLVVRSEERRGTRYTALRPAHRAVDARRPAALGGAGRTDWPDACALVGAQLLAETGRDYVELPVSLSRKAMGVGLPHPSVCRFAAERGSDSDIFSVTVRWVAPDAEAARTYATSVVPWGCNPSLGGCVTAGVEQPRRDVHLYTYRTGLRQSPVAHATVTAGRYVFGVSAGNDEARARKLVRSVALYLSQYAVAG